MPKSQFLRDSNNNYNVWKGEAGCTDVHGTMREQKQITSRSIRAGIRSCKMQDKVRPDRTVDPTYPTQEPLGVDPSFFQAQKPARCPPAFLKSKARRGNPCHSVLSAVSLPPLSALPVRPVMKFASSPRINLCVIGQFDTVPGRTVLKALSSINGAFHWALPFIPRFLGGRKILVHIFPM